jgi:uncharacterized protein (DUF2141 family)
MGAVQMLRKKSVTLVHFGAAISLAAITSCGDSQGNEVGKDPRVPLVLKQPIPESPAPVQTGAGSPLDGNEPKIPGADTDSGIPNSGTTPPNLGTGEPSTPPQQPTSAALTVKITGLHSERGNICLSMFNSAEGFPDSASKAVLAECFAVIGRSFDITIEKIPNGTYAIALWHDENRDGKLNYNFLGIPKEGLAFSENGKPRITPPPPGPPSFSSIAFEMKGEPRSTPTKMSYLLDLL